MAKVVVTGGSGFIGARVVTRLRECGADVTVLDVVAPAADDVRGVVGSVLDLDTVVSAIAGADSVVHMAGPVRGSMRSAPLAGATLQLQGTLNVLEACCRADVAHLAFASSFYVYDGIDPAATVDEQTLLDVRAVELFGRCKLMGETLCRDWSTASGLGVVMFRIGPAYGGGGTSAVDQLLLDGLAHGAVEIWGSGDRHNQYTYVGDLADAICTGLDHDGETYNLTSPEAVTLAQLGELMRGFGVTVVHDESRPAGPHLPTIDSSKAFDELGWAPVALEDGLRRMLEEQQVKVM